MVLCVCNAVSKLTNGMILLCALRAFESTPNTSHFTALQLSAAVDGYYVTCSSGGDFVIRTCKIQALTTSALVMG